MGIWAWDWAHRQLVLVIVSVLAMLGDNPMQSEFSCHIGFMGRLFCRVCWASRGAAHEETEGADVDDGEVGEAAAASGRGKKRETLHEMIQRLNAFISVRFFMLCTESAPFTDAVIEISSTNPR